MLWQLLDVLLALALTVGGIRLLWRPALKMDLVDHPCTRKRHDGRVPLIGGLAMCLAFCLTLLTLHAEVVMQLPALLVGGFMLMLVGLVDDLREISVPLRFVLQIGAVLLLTLTSGDYLGNLGNLFGSGDVQLKLLALPFTLFAVIGVINAMNMADGLDGLAGGISVVVLLCFGAIALAGGLGGHAAAVWTLLGCVLGFLAFNLRHPWRRKAGVFMGDAGSMFLGFVLAWLAMSMSQGENRVMAPMTAVWILGLPIMDTVHVMLRRMQRGVSPFTSGRDHLHYLLVDAGLSVGRTVWLLVAAAAALAGTGLAGHFRGWSEPAMCTGFVALSLAYYIAVLQLERRIGSRARAAA